MNPAGMGPPDREKAPTPTEAASTRSVTITNHPGRNGRLRTIDRTRDRLASRTVDWWSVHTYVLPVLTAADTWPMAGTVTWSKLDDDDPAKLAALFDAARQHALRVDAAQAALAEASHDIAAAADWSIARKLLARNAIYIRRTAAS